MSSIKQIVERQRPGKAGNWEVVPGTHFREIEYSVEYPDQAVREFNNALYSSLVLCHYDWPMLAWRPAEPDELDLSDEPAGYEVVLAGEGWASVSDQGGIRKAADALNLSLRLVRGEKAVKRLGVGLWKTANILDNRAEGALLLDGDVLSVTGRRVVLNDGTVKNWPCWSPLLWRSAHRYYTPPVWRQSLDSAMRDVVT